MKKEHIHVIKKEDGTIVAETTRIFYRNSSAAIDEICINADTIHPPLSSSEVELAIISCATSQFPTDC